MQLPHIILEYVDQLGGSESLGAWREVHHFRQAVKKAHDGIVSPLSRWEVSNQIH